MVGGPRAAGDFEEDGPEFGARFNLPFDAPAGQVQPVTQAVLPVKYARVTLLLASDEPPFPRISHISHMLILSRMT
jgi:hypothetical protein